MSEEHRGFPAKVFFLLTRIGEPAVLVFFTLSGFLIGGPAIRAVLTRTFNLQSFIRDRICRIYPPLLVTLALSWILDAYLGHWDVINAQAFWGTLFGLQGILAPNFGDNPVLWTLAYETWFYVLIGSWCTLLQRRNSGQAEFGAFLVSCLSVIILSQLDLIYVACFAVGVLFSSVVLTRQVRPLHIALSAAVFFGAIAANQLASDSQSFVLAIPKPSPNLTRLLVCVSFCWFFRTVSSVSLAPKAQRIWSVLAGFSYSLYLTHPLVLSVKTLLISGALQDAITPYGVIEFIGTLAVCVLVAFVVSLPAENVQRFRKWYDVIAASFTELHARRRRRAQPSKHPDLPKAS